MYFFSLVVCVCYVKRTLSILGKETTKAKCIAALYAQQTWRFAKICIHVNLTATGCGSAVVELHIFTKTRRWQQRLSDICNRKA